MPKNKRRILLVDDNEELLEVIEARLASKYEIHPTGTVDHAVKLIEQGPAPDILITDFQLNSRKDGIDLARLLRSKYPETPILLMTASPLETDRIRNFMGLESVLVLPKPFALSDLESMLQGIFSRT